jgi:hypothetical protein
MTTHFQKLLRAQADGPLLSGQGDDARTARLYLVNGIDCFLAKAAQAAVEDGIDPRAVSRMFVTHALEALNRAPGATPAAARANAEFVLQEALRIHSLYDDPDQAA